VKAFFRIAFCVAIGGLLSLGARAVGAQTPADAQAPTVLGPTYYDSAIQFWSGQDVVPTFDGWMQNDDGTFTLVFGYFNRNYREELVIPPGPNNNLSPGDVDQGQPTIFVPRRQKWVLLVKVPKDFGDKEVVWTLTSHGRTEKATGKLIRQLFITPRLIMSKGGLSPGLNDPNKPPEISIPEKLDAKVSRPLTLSASVSDDGIPKPRVQKAAEGGQTNGVGRPVNLTVSWLPYRGPAGVTFDDPGKIIVTGGKRAPSGDDGPIAVADTTATTAAHFSAPGTYTLIATADDSELTTSKTVTVNVTE
jgi:hypothetical protein